MARKKKRIGSSGLQLYARSVFFKKKKEKEDKFSERREEREQHQQSISKEPPV